MTCKFWTEPVMLARNYGFLPKELNRIREAIRRERQIIMEAWHEHCDEITGSKN